MQKTAKNISLSIAGVMVAVPAGADIASIDYVQRWVQNQSPVPAGSVITGYASGSYGSYLLAGSTVGGPYSGVSIENIGSKMSPYIKGSKIAGYEPAGSVYTQYVAMLTGSTGAIVYKDAPGFITGFLSTYGHVIADMVKGYAYSWFNPNPGSGSSSPVSMYLSTYGSYIGGYQSGSGAMTKILGFTGTGSSIGSETAKWFDVSSLINSSGLGYSLGWGSYGSEIVVSEMGSLKRVGLSTIGSQLIEYGYLRGSKISGYSRLSGGATGSIYVMGGLSQYGSVESEVPVWLTAWEFGSYIYPYLSGSLIDNVRGSRIYGYNTTGVSTGSSAYILAGSSTGGAASWMQINSNTGNGTDLADHLFYGSGVTSGVPTHILGSPTGGTGNVPGYYSVSKMGTVIGTVNGSQVKIEQTATAETLQANTGTIYFPVVQNGTIYGVTLNDFYILMNAQF